MIVFIETSENILVDSSHYNNTLDLVEMCRGILNEKPIKRRYIGPISTFYMLDFLMYRTIQSLRNATMGGWGLNFC